MTDTESTARRSVPSRRKLAALFFAVALLLPALAGGAPFHPNPNETMYDEWEDFEGGNTGTWSGDNQGVVEESYEDTYSVHLDDEGTGGSTAGTFTGPDLNWTDRTQAFYGRLYVTSGRTLGPNIRLPRGNDDNRIDIDFTAGSGDVTLEDFNGGTGTTVDSTSQWSTDTWYDYHVEINESNYVKMWIWESGSGYTTQPQLEGYVHDGDPQESVYRIDSFNNDRYFDQAAATSFQSGYEANGTVLDDDTNNPITDARVIAINESGDESANVTVNNLGEYEMFLDNGTYNVTASADGYYPRTETNLTVDGAGFIQDFRLVNQSDALNLKVRPYIEHGQSVPYEVIASPVNQTTGEVNRQDVTDNSTVSSNNVSVVIVDGANQEVTGTSDLSVNQRTYLTATWTNPDTGNTLTATQNVTVANNTVNNLKILPPVNRFTAPLSGGTDDNPQDRSIAIIFVAVGAGIVASRWATSFAGGAATVMVFEMGWIMGMVGDGMAIVAVFIGTFVLLNVAGNVDYTVRRG